MEDLETLVLLNHNLKADDGAFEMLKLNLAELQARGVVDLVLIDSGSAHTCCPLDYGKQFPLEKPQVHIRLRTATDQRPPWGTSKTSSSKSNRSSAQKRPLHAGHTTEASVRWGRATEMGGTSSS